MFLFEDLRTDANFSHRYTQKSSAIDFSYENPPEACGFLTDSSLKPIST